jgi:hypothetical protein
MNKLQEIARLVDQLDEQETRQVFDMCRRRLRVIDEIKVAAFRPGQKVKFKSRHGMTLVGTVEKVNQKTASVSVPYKSGDVEIPQIWRVSLSLLSPA